MKGAKNITIFPNFRYESCVINCEKAHLCIIMFFDSSYAQGHKGKLVLSFFHSSKYKKKEEKIILKFNEYK